MVARSLIEIVYPPRCIGCGGLVQSDFGLCPACWSETPFISGTVCNGCGVALPGESDGDRIDCDSCLAAPRPWVEGRAALSYGDRARSLVLALKHGDRPEIALAAGPWLSRAAAPMLREDMIIAPIPLHWTRLWQRRYNQSALLAQALADQTGLPVVPDLLHRARRTPTQDGKTVRQRFANLDQAIRVDPRRVDIVQNRPVLLVDDVLTSGATLAETTRACQFAGSGDVFVLALARAVRDD